MFSINYQKSNGDKRWSGATFSGDGHLPRPLPLATPLVIREP